MRDLAAHAREIGAEPLEQRRLGAHHDRQRAVHRGLRGPGHGCIRERHAAGARRRVELAGERHRHRAHVHERAAGVEAPDEAVGAEADGTHLGLPGQTDEDDIGPRRDVGDRGGALDAVRGEGVQWRRARVEGHDARAGLRREVLAHRLAHDPEADESENIGGRHVWGLPVVWRSLVRTGT
jgi:hypothetical protein